MHVGRTQVEKPSRAGGLCYFGGTEVKVSRLRPGSGFGLGFGAFFTSFLPLSLLPIGLRMPQCGAAGKRFAHLGAQIETGSHGVSQRQKGRRVSERRPSKPESSF